MYRTQTRKPRENYRLMTYVFFQVPLVTAKRFHCDHECWKTAAAILPKVASLMCILAFTLLASTEEAKQ